MRVTVRSHSFVYRVTMERQWALYLAMPIAKTFGGGEWVGGWLIAVIDEKRGD